MSYKLNGYEWREGLYKEDNTEDAGRALAEFFGTVFNGSGRPFHLGKAFAVGISKQHRTLQGLIINFLLATLHELGQYEKWTDARNEVSIKTCKKIADMLDDEGGYNPFI